MLGSKTRYCLLLGLLATPALAAEQSSGTENQTAAPGAATAAAAETRDWSAIDTDKDSYVSAAEMEKYLKETWAKQEGAAASR